jgi:predicted metal-binding membrane protein
MKEQPVSDLFLFRMLAIVFGSISLGLGWGAISQGVQWHSGYNARVGTETSVSTLSWVIYGVLLIIAGIFPWKWLTARRKR